AGEEPPVVRRPPPPVERRARAGGATSADAHPLDAAVADVAEEDHADGRTLTSPETKRRTPWGVSSSSAPCTSTPLAIPVTTPRGPKTSTGLPCSASAACQSARKGFSASRSNSL